MKKFKHNCYLSLFDEIQTNKECTSWAVNRDSTAIESGYTNKTDITFFSELILVTKLRNPGKVNIMFI